MDFTEFYNECCEKDGFNAGGYQPTGIYDVRDSMVAVINSRLERKGINTHRLTNFDRPETRNKVVVRWTNPETGEIIEEPEGFDDILAELDEEYAIHIEATLELLDD